MKVSTCDRSFSKCSLSEPISELLDDFRKHLTCRFLRSDEFVLTFGCQLEREWMKCYQLKTKRVIASHCRTAKPGSRRCGDFQVSIGLWGRLLRVRMAMQCSKTGCVEGRDQQMPWCRGKRNKVPARTAGKVPATYVRPGAQPETAYPGIRAAPGTVAHRHVWTAPAKRSG